MTEGPRFWSHRKGFRPPLTGEFFQAFDSLLLRLVKRADSSRVEDQVFGGLVEVDNYGRYFDGDLQRAVREQLGREDYCSPLQRDKSAPRQDDHVLDLIEVFFYLAQPRSKKSYAQDVNSLLRRMNQPYELIKGQVHYRGSEVLDAPVEALDGLHVPDDQLRKYLEAARDAFFDSREDRRLEGLRSLYDAFERLKTLREGDKKGSAAQIVAELAPYEELRPHFEEMFRRHTALGNASNIRHSEKHVTLIDHDPVLIEHLFYSTFSLIRAVLMRAKPPTR